MMAVGEAHRIAGRLAPGGPAARSAGARADDLRPVQVHKLGSNLTLWDSTRRAATGAPGPADGSRGMIDALHHAAHTARSTSLTAARELLDRAGLAKEPRFVTFVTALEAILGVLPLSPAGMAIAGSLTSTHAVTCRSGPADAAETTLTPPSSSHLVRAAPVSADVAGRVLISYAERGWEPQAGPQT